MIILPAVDILGGRCVRLYKGDYSKSENVAPDVIETALRFQSSGAEYIHLVDLDGAKEGKTVNLPLFERIIKAVSVPLELGGGIRSLDVIEKYLEMGISRCILGSVAVKNPGIVTEAVKKWGDKIAVGIDARNRMVSASGWTEDSDTDFITLAKKMEDVGVKNIIFTDIDRDGTQNGCNLEQLGELKAAVSCNITASGGIRDISDIKALKKMNIYGAITGKAIYSGSLDLDEAIKCTKERD